jgi:hypothetical protein
MSSANIFYSGFLGSTPIFEPTEFLFVFTVYTNEKPTPRNQVPSSHGHASVRWHDISSPSMLTNVVCGYFIIVCVKKKRENKHFILACGLLKL